MADNTRANPGAGGDLIATDEVIDGTLGTVKVQYVKIMDGTLDGTGKAAVGTNGVAADVKASVLPTGASTATNQSTGNTSLASIDGKITAVNTGAVVISSGSVTANAGTNLNTSALALDATLTGGTAKSVVTGNAASAATDSGNPVKVGGKYNATPPTLTDGQRGDAQMNSAASLRMTEADLLAGENLAYNRLMTLANYSYTNITTNATTVAKSGPGFLHAISINNVALLTVANLTLTVWDNTAASGTKVGVFTVPFGLTTSLPFFITFNTIMTTGITIQTAGPTVTADITVEWL